MERIWNLSVLVFIFHINSYSSPLLISFTTLRPMMMLVLFDECVIIWVMSSAKLMSVHPGPASGRPLVYIKNNIGAIMEPWATPLISLIGWPMNLSILILAILSSLKLQDNLSNIFGRLRLSILYFRPFCQILSKAWPMSQPTMMHYSFFFCDIAILSYREAMATSVPLPPPKSTLIFIH